MENQKDTSDNKRYILYFIHDELFLCVFTFKYDNKSMCFAFMGYKVTENQHISPNTNLIIYCRKVNLRIYKENYPFL